MKLSAQRLSVAVLLCAAAGQAVAATQCTTLSGGRTLASPISDAGCLSCNTTYPQRAVDGNLSTAATLVGAAVVDGLYGLRATAQKGIVFPAGSKPGVVLEVNKSISVATDAQGTVRTYLGRALQNEYVFDAANLLDVNLVGQYRGMVRFKASKPFDAVEVRFSGSYTGYTIEVFEFCSDSQTQ